MKTLSSLFYDEIDTESLLATKFRAGIVSSPTEDFELICDANSGIVRSLSVTNFAYGKFVAIGVDDFGVGSEHIIFENIHNKHQVLFFYKGGVSNG